MLFEYTTSFHNVCFPGLFFLLPFIDAFKSVDIRTATFDVPPQEVSTSRHRVASHVCCVSYMIGQFGWTVALIDKEEVLELGFLGKKLHKIRGFFCLKEFSMILHFGICVVKVLIRNFKFSLFLLASYTELEPRKCFLPTKTDMCFGS